MSFLRKYIRFSILILGFINLAEESSCEGFVFELESLRRSDLSIFLNSLKKITTFAINNANTVDINLMFGIFLAKVNVEAWTRDSGGLPAEEADLLREVLSGCDAILHNFHYSMALHNSSDRAARISSLFTNTTSWSMSVPPYTPLQVTAARTLARPASTHVNYNFTWQWHTYGDAIRQFEAWVPSPQLSDACLETLVRSAEPTTDSMRPCSVSKACYAAVYRGTSFGYALTHRLLLLMSGWWSLHCHHGSLAADWRLARRLCARAHAEAVYIAHSNHQLGDLFMEQISVCSLLGHVEFLHRPWILQIASWQNSVGCFQKYFHHPVNEGNRLSESSNEMKLSEKIFSKLIEINSRKGSKTKYNQENDKASPLYGDGVKGEDVARRLRDIMEHREGEEVKEAEMCDGHVTAVAAAALAAAVRFILQFYY